MQGSVLLHKRTLPAKRPCIKAGNVTSDSPARGHSLRGQLLQAVNHTHSLPQKQELQVVTPKQKYHPALRTCRMVTCQMSRTITKQRDNRANQVLTQWRAVLSQARGRASKGLKCTPHHICLAVRGRPCSHWLLVCTYRQQCKCLLLLVRRPRHTPRPPLPTAFAQRLAWHPASSPHHSGGCGVGSASRAPVWMLFSTFRPGCRAPCMHRPPAHACCPPPPPPPF